MPGWLLLAAIVALLALVAVCAPFLRFARALEEPEVDPPEFSPAVPQKPPN